MADAYKCDVTGKLHEGKPPLHIVVPVTKDVSLLIYPQRRLNERQNEPGNIGPTAIAAIEKALSNLKVG